MQAPGATPSSAEPEPYPGAKLCLGILFVVNLLNYIDRYVPSATKQFIQLPPSKGGLGLTDTESALPLTSFLIVYMLTSPIFGQLADYGYSRPRLLFAGVISWSMATALAGLSTNFATMMVFRSLVGVGEACFATITPAMLSDFYPPAARSRALGIFFVSIPVGAAMGYLVGGWIGSAFGWRAAFYACGIPGIFISFACLYIKDAPRGNFDHLDSSKVEQLPVKEALLKLGKNAAYVVAVIGQTFNIFASGGMADWFPVYLIRVYGIPDSTAATIIGGTGCIGGIVGTVLGYLSAEKMKVMNLKNPYLLLCAIATAPSALFAFFALAASVSTVALVILLLFCQIFLWFYIGPLNAYVCNITTPDVRTRAFAISILFSHAFGDAISPTIVGAISDATGNLTAGVAILPIALMITAFVWGVGWYFLPNPPTENGALGERMISGMELRPRQLTEDVTALDSNQTAIRV